MQSGLLEDDCICAAMAASKVTRKSITKVSVGLRGAGQDGSVSASLASAAAAAAAAVAGMGRQFQAASPSVSFGSGHVVISPPPISPAVHPSVHAFSRV